MLVRRRFASLAVLVIAALVLVVVPSHAGHGQFYVLDGFGGIHAGGGAPTIAPDVSFANYVSTFRDCGATALGFRPRDIVTLHKTYAVSAGSHAVRLMVNFNARSAGGSLHWDSPLLTATFIDQDFDGTSAPAAVPPVAGR